MATDSAANSSTRFGHREPWLRSFVAFARPHTLIGTTLSVLALFALAWIAERHRVPGTPLLTLVVALAACLGANIYIVGLNQLFDVEIDRVNKPDLPLASGAFSRRDAWGAVGAAGTVGLLMGGVGGGFLWVTVWLSLAIGTAYSLPPLRLKRFPALAALCILLVRGPVVNLGLFLHFRRALGGPAQITPEVWGLCAFVLALAVVIALFKDIPDIVGDRQYRVLTFAVRFGRETIFRLSQAILVLSYLSLTLAAALWMPGVHVEVLAAAHLGALAWALVQGRGLTQRAPEALLRLQYREYYRTIWRLFYLEYLAFPVACALSR